MKEEELEFVSVRDDEDSNNMNNSYVDPSGVYESDTVGSRLCNQTKNPQTIFFHLLFKTLAMVFYMFGSWFTSNFILIFVVCILLLAFDFWTVKNVSGRLLVGLRWWSFVKEDGNPEFRYESLDDMTEISSFDSLVFWRSMWISIMFWICMLVLGVVRLQFTYMPIVGAALALNYFNATNYYQCSTEATEKLQKMVRNGMRHSAVSSALESSGIRNWVLNTLLSVGTAGAAAGSRNSATNRGLDAV